MEVSVIIPCYNAAATIGEQLDALGRQSFGQPWEVIVVDDASQDDSVAVIEGYVPLMSQLRLVKLHEHGTIGRARNAGIEEARGRKLLFCDADDVVAEGWLAAMTSALDDHEFVAGAREDEALNEPWMRKMRQMPQVDGLQRWDDPPFLLHAGGGNLGMTRRLQRIVGPFDESLHRLEDTDLCFRVQLSGHQLHFEPGAVVHVRLRPSVRGMYRQARGWAESSVALHRKYQEHGMTAPNWRRGIGAWALALPRLLTVRSRGDMARWMFRVGWRVGRLRGSIRCRMLAL